MSKYSTIPDNSIFETSTGRYRKLDSLYYEDLVTGFQSTWSPIFDSSIQLPDAVEVEEKELDDKEYILDPQSRLLRKNPNFRPALRAPDEAPISPAEVAFGEMWGTGNFDCGPEEYEYMSKVAIAALKVINELAATANIPPTLDHFADISFSFSSAFNVCCVLSTKDSDVEVPAKNKVVKQATKKAVKKAPKKGK